ncbi:MULTISPECIES: HNH/endonuclease VII fold putative polymorphic toxin [unclassified Bacillus cereus group]|uniref:HNH/endonuclease VII fold putative polymorphic toxin n=1 Tax=unclassified Bacillus cereus group TaxID=2750818 RepID=UPI001F5AB3C3|nr:MULTISPECIES: HNH/endonuclease VII fold putative polymorphic toxin [unclassified Bacillus cereus group]
MSLNMYLGEVQSQTQNMNAVCTATIQGMEQAIQLIDTFALDPVLQGQTYESAKAFFAQTFRPLAQGIIYLCEELIQQNNAFPRDFAAQVAQTDVIEQELREQIQQINQMISHMEEMNAAMPIPSMGAMIGIFVSMKQKLEEKLEHLYEFNTTSSSNYDTVIQLAASIATGLAEVQSGKGFRPVSGTFSTQGLNIEWANSIRAITADRKHQSEEESIIDKSLLDKFKDAVETEIEAMDQLSEKFFHQTENTSLPGLYYNYKKGQTKAVLDELKGILNTILHPIDSFEGAVYAFSHIDETFAAVEQAISDSWNQDVVNGDWNSRARWIGNVEAQVKLALAELLVGTKGVDKISKLGKVSRSGKASKLNESVNFIQGVKNVINFDKFKQSVNMLNNILIPKNQVAYAGIGKFNYESPTLKDFFVQASSGESKGLNNKIGKDSFILKNIEIVRNRTIAFNKAKDLAGIPRSQQPTRQWQVGDDISKKGYESKNYEYSANHTHHGRYYEYDTPQGKRVIVEHINDGVLHTHAGKPKDGANPYTYDFKKERYSNIYGTNNDHHLYYNK